MKFIYTFADDSNESYRVNIVLEDGDDKSEVIIPDSYNGKKVTHLTSKMFDEFGADLKTIVFGDNIKMIYPTTLFAKCTGLETIYLGKNITSSLANTDTCPNLKNVFFNGTKEEWETKKANGNFKKLEDFDVRCGTMYNKVQLKQDDKTVFPITHWDCVKGKPEEFPGGGGSGSQVLGTKSVKTEHLADSSVTEEKIAKNAVKTDHIADYSITENKLLARIIGSGHIKEKAVGTNELNDKAVTDEKINDKTISKGKMAFDVATEDFVRNSIRNISGGKPLIGDVVSILDDFEGYEIHQVVKTTDLIPKSWSKVKIWSAEDGITATETNPTTFDFSQIAETNYTKTTALPTQIDFSTIAGRNVICSLIFKDDEVKKAIIIQLLQPTGSNPTLTLMLYFGDGTEPLLLSYTSEQGWLNDGKQLTEANMKLLETTFPALKIVDFASMHKDNPEVAPEGVEFVPEILVDIFLKNWMQVYYPMGYYLTDKSADSIPKSWSEVQRVVRSGQASKVFNIGDQLICNKNGVAHVWDIIGIDHDEPLNPNYKHSITLQLNTALDNQAFDDDSHDYSLSNVRQYLNGDYLEGFDEDFLAVVGGIRKSDLLYNTDEESEEDDIYPESDIFFLLSDKEVSTEPYEYYSSADANLTIRIKTAGNTSLCHWWLRSNSTANGNSGIADKVGTDGAIGVGNITRASYYAVPACVIY